MKHIFINFPLLVLIFSFSAIYNVQAQQQKLFIVTSCEVKSNITNFLNEDDRAEKNELENIILGQKMLVTKLEGVEGLSRVTRFKFSFLKNSFTLENSYGVAGFTKYGKDHFQLATMNWNDREFNGYPSNLLLYIKSNHNTYGELTFIIRAKYSSN